MIDPVPSMHRCFMNDLIIYGSVSCIGCPSEARDLPTHASYTNQQTHASMGSPKKSFFFPKRKTHWIAWGLILCMVYKYTIRLILAIYIWLYHIYLVLFFSWWNHHLSGILGEPTFIEHLRYSLCFKLLVVLEMFSSYLWELFFKKIHIVYQHMNYIGWRYIFLMVNLKVILWFWTIWIYKKLMIKY